MIVNFKRGDTFEAVVRLRDGMGALVDLVAGGITCTINAGYSHLSVPCLG